MAGYHALMLVNDAMQIEHSPSEVYLKGAKLDDQYFSFVHSRPANSKFIRQSCANSLLAAEIVKAYTISTRESRDN